eukprot:TRINITY_DN4536_c0_g1_i1.p1 TRINITY_DN4536_c0_g1~~TRINITY_DN4536_c0_g1_i1.p1  ORF type:complete len:63 (-),score=13.53 TRINITY_DN4536_c0_g1_i1:217-405(-)
MRKFRRLSLKLVSTSKASESEKKSEKKSDEKKSEEKKSEVPQRPLFIADFWVSYYVSNNIAM